MTKKKKKSPKVKLTKAHLRALAVKIEKTQEVMASLFGVAVRSYRKWMAGATIPMSAEIIYRFFVGQIKPGATPEEIIEACEEPIPAPSRK